MKYLFVLLLLILSSHLYAGAKMEESKFIKKGIKAQSESPDNQENLADFTAVSKEKTKQIILNRAEDWYNNFNELLKTNNQQAYIDENKLLYRRYELIKSLNIDGKTEKNIYMNTNKKYSLDEYNKNYKTSLENKEKEIDALYSGFSDKWGMGPNMHLLDGYDKEYPDQIESAMEKYDKIKYTYYNGKNKEIKIYLDYYKNVLSIIHEINIGTDGTARDYFNRNIEYFSKTLNELIKQDKGNFEKEVKEYNENIMNKENSFDITIDNMRKNIGSKEIDPDSDLDYYINEKDNRLFLGKKNLDMSDEVKKYQAMGLNVKTIGFIDDVVYICTMGNLDFYDSFTLKPLEKDRVSFDRGNKTILFINDPDANRLAVKSMLNGKEEYEYKILTKTEKKGRFIFTF
jgi:hypothetical protein